MTNETIITVNNVCKSFGKTKILGDISLEVKKGEIFGLLGPSGCGKTTTIKIIAGVLKITSGDVTIIGQKIPSLEIMGKTGYMAQADAVYNNLTGRENLEFFGKINLLKKKEITKKIAYLAELLELTDCLDLIVINYSGGMKRRLSLAMALINDPELLILDEPTVGVDPVLKQSIWDELKTLAKNGITILMTTHVMDEAERCDRIAMIRNGKVMVKGCPMEITQNLGVGNLEEAFIELTRRPENEN